MRGHNDIEFHVQSEAKGRVHLFRDFGEAAAKAVAMSIEHDRFASIGVFAFSEKGAVFYGGVPAVQTFAAGQTHKKGGIEIERIIVEAGVDPRIGYR
jgi:hypothetical protein